MGSRREIIVEPDSYALKGFELEELLSETFLKHLRTEFPNAEITHFVFDLITPQESIVLAYPRKEKKNIRDRVVIDSSETSLLPKIIDVIKRCFE